MVDYKRILTNLVRGELSAVKTYDQVLERAMDHEETKLLRRMRSDHSRALNTLIHHLDEAHEKVPRGPGAWGAVAKTVTGVAGVFGEINKLKALREGEEHGRGEYQQLLQADQLPEEIRNFVGQVAIPNQNRHIDELNGFIGNLH